MAWSLTTSVLAQGSGIRVAFLSCARSSRPTEALPPSKQNPDDFVSKTVEEISALEMQWDLNMKFYDYLFKELKTCLLLPFIKFLYRW